MQEAVTLPAFFLFAGEGCEEWQSDMEKDSIEPKFHSLLSEVDKAFAALKQRYAAEICCGPGCDDCCHAVFSVSLAEAYFIERHVRSRLLFENPEVFEKVRKRAEDFKKELEQKEVRFSPVGNDQASMELYGQWRIRCPMLADDRRCAIYQLRPLTCRAYGLPLSISGRGHVCGLSGFTQGTDYPTIKMDNIHRYLLDLSKKLVEIKELGPEMATKREFLAAVVLRLAGE